MLSLTFDNITVSFLKESTLVSNNFSSLRSSFTLILPNICIRIKIEGEHHESN